MFAYKQVILPVISEIRASLQHIYGIGKYKAFCICARLGFGFPFTMKSLNTYYSMFLFFILDYYTWLEARIRRIYKQNVRFLVELNSYKGLRHKDRLPVRGQRTRTNSKTRKKTKFNYND